MCDIDKLEARISVTKQPAGTHASGRRLMQFGGMTITIAGVTLQ